MAGYLSCKASVELRHQCFLEYKTCVVRSKSALQFQSDVTNGGKTVAQRGKFQVNDGRRLC